VYRPYSKDNSLVNNPRIRKGVHYAKNTDDTKRYYDIQQLEVSCLGLMHYPVIIIVCQSRCTISLKE